MPKYFKKLPKQTVRQFLWYNLGGMVFFAGGYAVFVLLYGLLHWHWFWAKAVADLVGWSLNYIVQRYVAFRQEARQQKQHKLIGKFVGFSLLNVALDYAIVGGLMWLGISPFVGLWVSSLFFTVWKYAGYKHWVFKVPMPK